MKGVRRGFRAPAGTGSILVGLLWCVALVSVVVIGILHTTQTDLRLVKDYGDRVQAHYLALAGIEKAKALLHQEARQRSRSARNHTGELYAAPGEFREIALGRGHFSVIRRGRQDEGGAVIYGLSDEESRLNVNVATADQLGRLPGMTSEIVAAIADWRDPDSTVTPGGAELEYYASLRPPYQPRNGPLETVRELLMVRGITPQLLLGTDSQQNGRMEMDLPGRDSVPGESDPGSDVDAGWAGILTVDSAVRNVSAAGQERVDLQSADESQLTTLPGIGPEVARAIVAYRGQNRFQTIADLLDVGPPAQNPGLPPNPVPGAPAGTVNPPGGGPAPGAPRAGGPPVISESTFLEIADAVSVSSARNTVGAVNINTAGLDVLASLPGVDWQLAQAIVAQRQSSGFFPNVAWLLRVPGMSRETFKQLAAITTARSETFRIVGEGTVDSTGIRQRIQVIVRINLDEVRTLSWRENDV